MTKEAIKQLDEYVKEIAYLDEVIKTTPKEKGKFNRGDKAVKMWWYYNNKVEKIQKTGLSTRQYKKVMDSVTPTRDHNAPLKRVSFPFGTFDVRVILNAGRISGSKSEPTYIDVCNKISEEA